jgi:hypothetical protein
MVVSLLSIVAGGLSFSREYGPALIALFALLLY